MGRRATNRPKAASRRPNAAVQSAVERTMMAAMLSLKRASKSRAIGEWSAEDYNVFDGDRLIGHIVRATITPPGRPWFWAITKRDPQRPTDRGYAATLDKAMAAFKAAWQRKP
jgi:hypothetical protein